MSKRHLAHLIGLSVGFVLMACQQPPTNESNPEPYPSRGKLVSLNFIDSVIGARRVDVWIPDGLRDGDSVGWMWMHDGQMLYDSTVTWNKQEWMVDETLQKLIDEERVVPTVVIGMYNSAQRHRELFPQKPLEEKFPERVNDVLSGAPLADAYLSFATSRMIPEVLASLPFKTGTRGWVAGSSMGGLMSAYALCEYPNLFKGALCLSTHWPGAKPGDFPELPDMFINYFAHHLPTDGDHAIYFDSGDETLDSFYPEHHKAMETALLSKAENGSALQFRFEFFPGADHSENSWNKRLHIPFEWALSK